MGIDLAKNVFQCHGVNEEGEAVTRPNMRFATAKTLEQQAVLHCHHSRQLLVKQRVATSNHIRGVLLEYGISLPVGVKVLSQRLPEILEDAGNDLPMLTRGLIHALKQSHDEFNDKIKQLEVDILSWHKQSDVSQQLETIPGVGVLSASALAATIGDVHNFKNARQLAAYLGLVPGSTHPVEKISY